MGCLPPINWCSTHQDFDSPWDHPGQATVAALGTRGQHPITAAPHVRGAALNGRMDVHVETRWEVLIDRSLGEVPKFVEKETQLQIQEYHHLSP